MSILSKGLSYSSQALLIWLICACNFWCLWWSTCPRDFPPAFLLFPHPRLLRLFFFFFEWFNSPICPPPLCPPHSHALLFRHYLHLDPLSESILTPDCLKMNPPLSAALEMKQKINHRFSFTKPRCWFWFVGVLGYLFASDCLARRSWSKGQKC